MSQHKKRVLGRTRELGQTSERASASSEREGAGDENLERLVHELSEHQRELEQQNTALREAQVALEASRDQYALLYDSAPVGYATLDRAGRIHQVNLTAARLLGVERIKLLNRVVTTYVSRADATTVLAHLSTATAGAPAEPVEVTLRNHAREATIVRLESVPLRSFPYCLTALVDVTQARRLQDERERIERKLQETQRLESLGVLAGGIAHDFNNLLTAILGRASLGRLLCGADSPLNEHFCEIEAGAERAADLCRQMLSYAGRGKIETRAIDLSALIRGEERLLSTSIRAGGRLELDLEPDLPLVKGDLTQLRQLVMNLVLNASEALVSGGGSVVVRTRIVRATRATLSRARIGSHLPAGDYVTLEVRDDGAGMTATTLEHLFEPFYSTRFAGRGLGLAVVLGIARRHDLAIEVESAPQLGTTFRCWLPLAPLAFEAAPVPGVQSTFQGAGRILVVDDDEAVLRITAQMLQRIGFETVTASTGEEGLEVFARQGQTLRCVLLDLGMPGMDGRQVFRALVRDDPAVRVLLMSGFDEHEVMRGFGHTRPAGFVAKPLHLDVLRNALEKLLLEPPALRPRATLQAERP